MQLALKFIAGWYTMFFLFTISMHTNAQNNLEIGPVAGGSFYMGDINSTQPFYNTNFSGGFMLRYNLNSRVSLKGKFFMGSLSGDPADFSQVYPNPVEGNAFDRGYSSLSAEAEMNFYPFSANDISAVKCTPYISSGISMLGYNDYGEAGAPQEESLKFSPAIPVTLGVKYRLSEKFVLGAEWNITKTFIDDLDDTDFNNSINFDDPYSFGQHSSTHNNDFYSQIGIYITYKIYDGNSSCYGGYRGATKR